MIDITFEYDPESNEATISFAELQADEEYIDVTIDHNGESNAIITFAGKKLIQLQLLDARNQLPAEWLDEELD